MNNIVIKLENISKIYKLYDTPMDRLKESVHPFRKKYHRDYYALKDISFEVKKGEAVGIIGKNGSGKSTLLKLISGVLTPSTGNVTVNGKVSALLELGAGFNPELTGIENVYFNSTLMGYSKEEIDVKIDKILSFADIGDFVYQPVKTYSSGMFVRLAFAVAINVDPDILIVDEALSVGDIGFQQKCLHRLSLFQERGSTLILVSHDTGMIKNYCKEAIYLNSGKLLLHGDAENVTESYLKDLFADRQNSSESKSRVVWKNNVQSGTAFGTQHGTIYDFFVCRGEEERDVFSKGDRLTVKVRARVDETVTNPQIVLQLRDFRGYAIYGTDTILAGITFPVEKRKDGIIGASFTFDVDLAPGHYSVVLGLNDHVSDSIVIVHEKVVGALNFTVIEEHSKKFHGVVDLKALCENMENNDNVRIIQRGDYDIGEDALEWALTHSNKSEVLSSFVNISRKHFGWFTKQLARAFEYPWIFERIGEFSDRSILDIGTGVSPLPLLLAENGAKVTTVDNSQYIRVLGEDQAHWNGWGYLDYSGINKNICSIHEDILRVNLKEKSLDFIYSVSVIEHMSALTRKQLWDKVAKCIKDNGSILLTIDLVPDTEKIWNYCEGQQIDPEVEHGDIETLEKELFNVGFNLEQCEFLRRLPDSRVDTALIHFKKG